MSGGYNHRDDIFYSETYILSLPGFVWMKAPDSGKGARRLPACVSVNRQMIMVGGGSKKGWSDPDPAPQGLLLFDATELKWKDSYDADAAPYERSAELKKWYSDGYVLQPRPPVNTIILG